MLCRHRFRQWLDAVRQQANQCWTSDFKINLQTDDRSISSGLNNSIGPIARNCPKWPSGNGIYVRSCPPNLCGWIFGQPIFFLCQTIAHYPPIMILRKNICVDSVHDLISTVFSLLYTWIISSLYWSLLWYIDDEVRIALQYLQWLWREI